MKHFLILLRVLLLCFVSFVPLTYGQDSYEANRVLSLLRGSWEWHTYEDLQTLNFTSDSRVRFNNRPCTYSLQKDNLLITDEGETINYSFAFNKNRLVITFPDGKQIPMKKESIGEEEQRLINTFDNYDDPLQPFFSFVFQNDGTFTISQENSSVSNQSGQQVQKRGGIFRIEGTTIILTFTDSSVENALINIRISNGTIHQFVYNEIHFYRYSSIVEEPEPPPPCFPCSLPPPPCPECPLPPHPHPPLPNNPGEMPQPILPNNDANKPRDTGPERGTITSGIEPPQRSGENPPGQRGRKP